MGANRISMESFIIHLETRPGHKMESWVEHDVAPETLCKSYSAFKSISTSKDYKNITCKKCLRILKLDGRP